MEGADTKSLIPPSRSPVCAGAAERVGGGRVSLPPLAARGRPELDTEELEVLRSLVVRSVRAGGELRPDE